MLNKMSDLSEDTEHDTVFFKSKFHMLERHNGFRPRQIHVLMGSESSGKSSLTNSLIVEQLLLGKKILVHYSEDTNIPYIKTKITRAIRHLNGDESCLENLIYCGEMEDIDFVKSMEINEWLSWINSNIAMTKPDIFFFDNITTAMQYEGFKKSNGISHQNDIASSFKNSCLKSGIPWFIVAHTNGDFNGKDFATPREIRGGKFISNMAEYFYSILKIAGEIPHNYLYTYKARDYGQAIDKIHCTRYNPHSGLYDGDYDISFKDMVDIKKGTLTGTDTQTRSPVMVDLTSLDI